MQKWTTKLLKISLSLAAAGLLLLGIGMASGAKTDFSRISHERAKTIQNKRYDYQDLKKATFFIPTGDILIKESSDSQFHVSYYQDPEQSKNPIVYKDGELEIVEKDQSYFKKSVHVQTILQYFLNQESIYTRKLILEIPKGKKLDLLDVTPYSGNLSIEKSAFKQLVLHSYTHDVNLSQVTIQQGTISVDNGQLTVKDSQLNNLEFTSQRGELLLTKNKITDSTFNWHRNIQGQDLSLEGTTSIQSELGQVHLQLTPNSYEHLALDLSASNGQIEIPHQTASKDRQHLTYSPQNTKNKLIIKTTSGDILLK